MTEHTEDLRAARAILIEIAELLPKRADVAAIYTVLAALDEAAEVLGPLADAFQGIREIDGHFYRTDGARRECILGIELSPEVFRKAAVLHAKLTGAGS